MNQKINLTLALAIIGMLFFIIGFAFNINGILVPYLQKAFELSSVESYYVLTATFGAFVVFGYPSGLIVKKIGYKKSMSLAFLFFAVGLCLFIPSAHYENFILFLVASFISGMGNTLLQTAINPYVTICGPIESAAKRMCLMGILSKSGWAIAPLFLAIFLDLNETPVLSAMFSPFYIIVGVMIVVGIAIMFVPLPEISAQGEDVENNEEPAIKKFTDGKKNVLQFPHLLLGAGALFLYAGIETITLVTPIDYAHTLGFNNPEIYTTYTVISMIIGYTLGVILIPKVISQRKGLIYCSILGILFSLAVVTVSARYAIYFVALMGFSNSLVWGAVWPMAISYLGKFTKAGSSLLVTAIVGGAILPLLFGWLKDEIGIQNAYWMCLPFYLYTLYYALKGYKVGLKSFE